MLDYDFKIRIMCLLLLSFVRKSVGGVCPPPGEISPCICGDLGSEGLVVQLSCQGTNLDDSRASQILDKMFSWPRVSQLRLLDFSNNRLTKVPSQLPQFALLNSIHLENNQITSIDAGAFNLVSTFTRLNLDSNPITTIQEEAFQGKSIIYTFNIEL